MQYFQFLAHMVKYGLTNHGALHIVLCCVDCVPLVTIHNPVTQEKTRTTTEDRLSLKNLQLIQLYSSHSGEV